LILELAYSNDREIYREQMEIWLENARKSPWLSKTVSDKKDVFDMNRNFMDIN